MSWRQMKALDLIDFEKEPPLTQSRLARRNPRIARRRRAPRFSVQPADEGRSRLDGVCPSFPWPALPD